MQVPLEVALPDSEGPSCSTTGKPGVLGPETTEFVVSRGSHPTDEDPACMRRHAGMQAA